MNKLISVVIPVLNEEKNIKTLLKRLVPILRSYNFEIIFVNDGSTDNTSGEIKRFANKDRRIKLVSFQRNFGHQTALSCGYNFAKGDCVVTIDADLQDPPEIIPKMIKKWEEGVDVVYAKRRKREKDSLFKRWTAKLFYKLINVLSDTPIPDNVGDFRLLDRRVVKFINGLTEKSRFLRGLVAWGDFSSAFVYFDRDERNAGKTHYTLRKMINFALSGIMSFSTKPLRIASYLGFATATLGFLGIIYGIVGKLFFPSHWVTGWTALFTAILFLGGVQLITIGIIGEYIGQIYREVQNRPLYLIKEKVNL